MKILNLKHKTIEGAYICRYTERAVFEKDAVVVSPEMPQVSGCYLMENSDEARALRKQSLKNFAKSEANCNACHHFIRATVHREKGKKDGGFVFGVCLNPNKKLSYPPLLKNKEYEIMCHPSDFMGMSCWSAR